MAARLQACCCVTEPLHFVPIELSHGQQRCRVCPRLRVPQEQRGH